MTEAAHQQTPLTGNIRADRGYVGLEDYRRSGGYIGLERALKAMEPGEVQQAVKDSRLRGRGGAGFPTGMKWGFMPLDQAGPNYLVVNADEMEPGTFKDRLLMEGDPHQLVEGVAIAAYAVQASTAYIFVRDAYRLAAERLRQAIAEARGAGWLGDDVLSSSYRLEVHVHSSAGRYICGEETALLNALEGRRPLPRAKPPYPQQAGLWGRPTVVNNVETICNVPHIVRNGADWFRGLSYTEDAGSKIYGASGQVARPGAWELPMGTTLRELLEVHAGGMREGYRFRGVLPGGASTPFLVAEHLDLPMDFDHVGQAGSRLGTGALVVVDDRTSLMGLLRNLEHFFAQESCGWCTPCRDGLPWVEQLLADLEAGRGRAGDIAILQEHCDRLGPGNTFCAHAPGAVGPLESALQRFPEAFEQGVAG